MAKKARKPAAKKSKTRTKSRRRATTERSARRVTRNRVLTEAQLVKKIIAASGHGRSDVVGVIDAMKHVIHAEMRGGGGVRLANLAKFEVRSYKARSGETFGKRWHKPAGKKVKVVPLGVLKSL